MTRRTIPSLLLRSLLGTLLLAVPVTMAGDAHAQDRQSKCGEEGDGGAKYEIVRGADGRKIFRIKTAFCIEGKVPKPSVIYVLNASTINYEWDSLKRDFLPKVIDATKKEPF